MTNHPLSATLDRVRQFSAYLKPNLGPPIGEGWVAAADLAPGAARLEAMITVTQARLRTTAAAIVGSAILQDYQWPLVSTAVACYVLDRRVPDLTPATTRTHYTAEHEADALALLHGRFSALPHDPAADHPDATLVPDLMALCATLRTGIEAHFSSVIEHLCARLGCKSRGLWLNVADRLAGTLIWLAQEHNQATTLVELVAEVEPLIHAPGSPLASRQSGLIQLSHQDRSQVFLQRATCCYWYKTEGGDYCSTCPHRTLEDRRTQLLGYLAEVYAKQHSATQETPA